MLRAFDLSMTSSDLNNPGDYLKRMNWKQWPIHRELFLRKGARFENSPWFRKAVIKDAEAQVFLIVHETLSRIIRVGHRLKREEKGTCEGLMAYFPGKRRALLDKTGDRKLAWIAADSAEHAFRQFSFSLRMMEST